VASFTIDSRVTTPQVLRNGESGLITAAGTLATVDTPAVTGSGRFSLTVQGDIRTTGADAIHATRGDVVTVTVAPGGLISATGGQAIDITAEVIRIVNSGTISGDITLTDIAVANPTGITVTNRGLVDGDITITGDTFDVIDLRDGEVTGTVSGGYGNDDYYVDSTDDRIVEPSASGAPPDAHLFDEIFSTVSYVLPTGSNIEALHLLGTADIDATATGPDRIQLHGNSGRNTLTAGAGVDYLKSNGGVDRMIGGASDDTYVTEGDDYIIEQPGGGTDSIDLIEGNSFITSYTLTTNVEVLTNYTSVAVLNGNRLDNVLTSSDLNTTSETFDGRGGIDLMIGKAGDDTYITDGGDTFREETGEGTDTVLSSVSLTLSYYESLENLTLSGQADTSGGGNGGDNTIIGNGGDNTLYGHGGADSLTGGEGNDSFVFSASMRNDNIDTITDFNVADDTIRLSDKVFTALSEGALPTSAFASNSTGQATDASDRIIYEVDTGRLFYDSDGTGSAPRGHFATLDPNLVLTATDFFVF
jgi:Ca2+-binding RTX toxin-like protein